MALCCINGVCVPYSALIPLLFYGLKWLLAKLTESGLIPKTWEEQINSFVHKSIHSTSSSSTNSNSSCCDATAGTCSNKSVEHTSHQDGEVTTITTMEQWESLFTTSSDSDTDTDCNVIICKFTAKWCGPCKVIQPYYESLAKDNTIIKFVTIDVDNSLTESIGTLADVAILPTFVLFQSKSTNVVSTYIGSDQTKLLNLVQSASALVETKKVQ